MAVRRSPPGARRQKAYSQIVNCRSEEQYAKVHKQAGEKGLVLVEFVAGWSTSSKTMQPYVEYLSKSAEFKKVKIVRVDIDALPALAKECNVKSLPTYQLYRAGEKLEEMSGASGHTLMTMLKTHIVKDVKKSGPGKLIGLVAGLLLGVFGLLKLKDQIEEWEAEEEERLAIAEAEEEARRMAEEEAARARKRMQQAQAAKARAANSARS